MVNINLENLRNSTLFGNNGEKIGKIGEVYLDDQTDQPTFATVHTGLFGTKETFVPLDQAQQTGDGVTVPFDKEFVKDAPNIDADGHLTPEEEQRIYEYYSVNYGTERHDGTAQGVAAGTGYDRDADLRDRNDADLNRREALAGETADYDRNRTADLNGNEGDVVAHEEHLRASDRVESRETGRVRLRKHVVTDTETVEVPVRREEVHVSREKIDSTSADARVNGGDVFREGEDDVVITTHEERPVVTTETVATERVSLDREVHTDTERVSGEVRREEIEIDEDGKRGL